MSARRAGELTSAEFWLRYWRSKPALDTVIPADYLLHDVFDEVLGRQRIRSALELGGFPGYFSVWLSKYRGVEAHLLDLVIDDSLLHGLLARNGLEPNAVTATQGDLWSTTPSRRYDLVFSAGLIEHFVDTRAVIARHLEFLADDGALLLELPNFRGLNGLVQRLFDADNWAKHNIECMDPDRLREICGSLGLRVERAEFYGRSGVWLEDEAHKPYLARLALPWLANGAAVVGRLLRRPTRWLAPYVVVVARRA